MVNTTILDTTIMAKNTKEIVQVLRFPETCKNNERLLCYYNTYMFSKKTLSIITSVTLVNPKNNYINLKFARALMVICLLALKTFSIPIIIFTKFATKIIL